MKNNKGFVLIEIIIIAVVLLALFFVVFRILIDSKNSKIDANLKADITDIYSQTQIFFNTNTANPNTYFGVCSSDASAGVLGVGGSIRQAIKQIGLQNYNQNGLPNVPSVDTASCNESLDGGSFAIEVPLKGGGMWCIDSKGTSKKTNSSMGPGGTICGE